MAHQYSTHHAGCLQKEKIISLVYFSQLMIIEKVDAVLKFDFFPHSFEIMKPVWVGMVLLANEPFLEKRKSAVIFVTL
jgi:hypothetical protein